MRRSSSYLPVSLKSSPRIDATYLDEALHTTRQAFPIGKFLTNGSFGMIFKHVNYIVKLEIRNEPNQLEMDLNHWASENNIGPKFHSWGKLFINRSDFDKLLVQMERRPKSLMPHWYKHVKNNTESVSVYYSILDHWSSDLRTWKNNHEDEDFYNIDVKIMEKLATSVLELHAIGYVHLDLLPKNILVNTRTDAEGKEEVIDIAITDFGNSIPRLEWFDKKESPEASRNNFVRYMLKHRELEIVGANLPKFSPSDDPYMLCYFWLMYEPNNFDWAIVTQYNLGPSVEKAMSVPYPVMPPRILFGADWLAAGVVKLHVKRRLEHAILGKISAFASVADLRRAINRKLPGLGTDFAIICTNEEEYVPAERTREPDFNISFAVQQWGSIYYVEVE
jgi:serine/threonine protein kinase